MSCFTSENPSETLKLEVMEFQTMTFGPCKLKFIINGVTVLNTEIYNDGSRIKYGEELVITWISDNVIDIKLSGSEQPDENIEITWFEDKVIIESIVIREDYPITSTTLEVQNSTNDFNITQKSTLNLEKDFLTRIVEIDGHEYAYDVMYFDEETKVDELANYEFLYSFNLLEQNKIELISIDNDENLMVEFKKNKIYVNNEIFDYKNYSR